jgi:hypothetical protein
VDNDEARFRARIRRVEGRDAEGGERGLAKVSSIEFEHGDGTVISASALPTGPGVQQGKAAFVCEIRRGTFEFCPICYGAETDSAEHVPPKAFGGVVMTSTCSRCNNTFGSRTESSLQDWFDRAVRIRFLRDGVRRPLANVRMLVLATPDGQFAMVPDRGYDLGGELADCLRGREPGLTMEFRPFAAAPVRTGMLKSAYLAAALHVGGVPDVPSAYEIRAELQAVISAPSGSSIVAGARASALRFHRTGAPASRPTLALAKAMEEGWPKYFISLAGTILVEWPFPEIDPEVCAGRAVIGSARRP